LNALGRHLILELKDCNPKLLDDLPFVQHTLIHAAESTGATIIGHTFHKFSPQGVTGVVAIAESHVCIHTWPEYGYAAADIFTCGENFDPEEAATIMLLNQE
jgi:S-adenosylmethionine decarboxylase proenzyme